GDFADDRVRFSVVAEGFEASEDDIESELEFGVVVVAGLRELGGGLDEVGIVVHVGDALALALHGLGGFFGSVERQASLLAGEAVGVGVHKRVGVDGRAEGEAGLAKASEYRVV